MLMLSEVNGGRASLNGVMFFSDSRVAEATLASNGTIEVKCNKRSNERIYLLDFFEKVPFIRGLVIIGQSLLVDRRIQIFLCAFACIIAGGILFFPQTNKVIPIPFIILAILVLLAVSLGAIRFSEVSKFHGAEHMVYNAYTAGVALTVENVKKMSRVSYNCGTNLVTIAVVIFVLLMSLFPQTAFLNILLSISLSYEVFRLQNNFMSDVFMTLGSYIQKYIVTAEPDDKQIETAILALKALDV